MKTQEHKVHLMAEFGATMLVMLSRDQPPAVQKQASECAEYITALVADHKKRVQPEDLEKAIDSMLDKVLPKGGDA